jgi:hypothetical protein
VLFRYGQCNQQITCVGPITCRLVSCVPPWEIDPTCTTTVAIDEGTRLHNAPCLVGGRGSIDVVEIDRRTVRVAGWALAVDSSASLDVQVTVDGTVVQHAVASQPRPDLAASFPGLGTDHGFDVRFEVPPGTHTVTVQAFPPSSPIDRFDVGSRVVGIGVPFGSLDVVGQVPGGVRVAGWVIDPDAAGPSPVHVYVDGAFAVETVADHERPDVAAAFPGTGTVHGFDVVVPAAPGERTLCAYAINTDEQGARDPALNRLLACRATTVLGRPLGSLDAVEAAPGGVRVAGWAIDPETTEALTVHVYVDGAIAGVATADRARPDVAAAFPAHGADHGFDVAVPAVPGRHDVCVYAIDAGSKTSGNPLLGCRSATVVGAPIGGFDSLQRVGDSVRVTGWAIDPGTADAIDVHVYVDGLPAVAARADVERPDVATKYPPFGPAHGFDVTVAVPPGAHEVCVYAIGKTSTANPTLGCRTAR